METCQHDLIASEISPTERQSVCVIHSSGRSKIQRNFIQESGGPTTYLGQFVLEIKKIFGEGGGGPDPMDLPPCIQTPGLIYRLWKSLPSKNLESWAVLICHPTYIIHVIHFHRYLKRREHDSTLLSNQCVNSASQYTILEMSSGSTKGHVTSPGSSGRRGDRNKDAEAQYDVLENNNYSHLSYK
jgi:hypothetical protein